MKMKKAKVTKVTKSTTCDYHFYIELLYRGRKYTETLAEEHVKKMNIKEGETRIIETYRKGGYLSIIIFGKEK
jgi:hypothetical protein